MKIKSLKSSFSMEGLSLPQLVVLRRSLGFFLSNFDGQGEFANDVDYAKTLNTQLDNFLSGKCKQSIEEF
jgi:hypothetical protein